MEFESRERCTAAMFHRSGTECVAAYNDGSIRMFDLDSVTISWSTTCHAAPIVSLAMDRGGSAVLAASRDGTLTVTGAQDGVMLLHSRDLIDILGGQPVAAFDTSPGDSAVCAVAWARGLAVCSCPWTQASLRLLSRYQAPTPSDVQACEF